MDEVFIATHFFSLFLEFFWSSSENWECVKAHWDESMNIWKEVSCSICSFSWTHAKAVTNWEECDVWRVKIIDEFHVREDVGVTSVIESYVMIWNVNDISTCRSSSNLYSLWTNAGRWMISGNHSDFSITEIFCSSFLHL